MAPFFRMLEENITMYYTYYNDEIITKNKTHFHTDKKLFEFTYHFISHIMKIFLNDTFLYYRTN